MLKEAAQTSEPPRPAKQRGLREFVADNAVVALAMLIGKLRGLITLPLVVRTIGTAGYGVWSQILAFVTLLAFIASWNLHLPMIRFIAAKKSDAPRIFSTILLLEMALTALGGLLLVPFARPASALFLGDAGFTKHLGVALALVFFSNIRLVNVNVYRAYGRFFTRSIVELAASAIELLAIIAALYVSHDLFPALVAMAAWSAIVAAITTWHAGRLTGLGKPSLDVARRALAYAVPLLPAALSLWVLDRADRFFVGRYLGDVAVGAYSASYALGCLVLQVQAPFQMTLFPKVAQLWDTDLPGAKKYIELSNKFFLTLAIPFIAGSYVIAPRLLKKLGNAEIAAQSGVLTAIVAAGVTLYGVSVMQVQVLHGARRTGVQGAVSLVAAALNVALNVVLLPRMGAVGAAIATLVAYGVTCLALGRAAREHLPISYFPGYLARCAVASGIMLAPMVALAPRGTGGMALAMVAGAATYFAALVLMRAFSAEEVDVARRAWRILAGRGAT